MRRPCAIILAIVLVLVAMEAIAYWWMHPPPAGLGQPVLCYQPNTSRTTPTANSQQPTADSPPPTADTYTPLPKVVTRAQPDLHCTTGTAARIDRDDGATIYLAYFEWDLSDSTNVLEAFRHLPDECMGASGLKLIDHQPPRPYQVGDETLSFDHTVFRDSRGSIVHAFKGTWVAGARSLIGNGFRGGSDQWRQIRWKAALHRFRPAYARVAQGAVRGIPNPDTAWQAFQSAMLVDLHFN